MELRRITSDHQASVPADVGTALGVEAGDQLCRIVENGAATVSKLDDFASEEELDDFASEEEEDRAFAALVTNSLAEEWLSDEDEAAFRDL